MPTIAYKQTEDFKKDLKRLLKKLPTLIEDIEIAKVFAIELFHLKNTDKRAIFPIPNFCTDELKICKLKKFACRALKGRGVKSGIRVIYSFDCQNCEVEFIEMYFKGEKESEDYERIKTYIKTKCQK